MAARSSIQALNAPPPWQALPWQKWHASPALARASPASVSDAVRYYRQHGWMLEELSGVAISMTHELLIVPEADAPGSVFRHGRRPGRSQQPPAVRR
jgi:hypothetical protein